jgi:hypothetical protein
MPLTVLVMAGQAGYSHSSNVCACKDTGSGDAFEFLTLCRYHLFGRGENPGANANLLSPTNGPGKSVDVRLPTVGRCW